MRFEEKGGIFIVWSIHLSNCFMRVNFDYQMSIPFTLFQFSKYIMTRRWCDFQKTLIVGTFTSIIIAILLWWKVTSSIWTTQVVISIVPQWLMDGLIKSENFPILNLKCRVSKIRLLGRNKEQICHLFVYKANCKSIFPWWVQPPQTVKRFRECISARESF